MPRLMSFAATIPQFRARTKTVTRRQGWLFLKPGDILEGVEKAQGLKAGEKVVRMGKIRVVSVCREPVKRISRWPGDVADEGFPRMTPSEFIDMYCRINKCDPHDDCTRIEFGYLDEPGGDPSDG